MVDEISGDEWICFFLVVKGESGGRSVDNAYMLYGGYEAAMSLIKHGFVFYKYV